MTDDTPRWALPLLAAGQAQKELWHNEALLLVDQLLQPSVVGCNLDVPPVAPAPGQSWIVGAAPTGAWTGQGGAMAGWSDGGWRFVAPREGCSAWSVADGAAVRYRDGAWQLDAVRATGLVVDGKQVVGTQAAAIAAPAGGSVIDVEGRTTLSAVLAVLRQHGLIAA